MEGTLMSSYRDKRDLELVDFFARALRDIDKLSQEEIEDIIYCGFQEYEKRYCITMSRTIH